MNKTVIVWWNYPHFVIKYQRHGPILVSNGSFSLILSCLMLLILGHHFLFLSRLGYEKRHSNISSHVSYVFV
uniref:40S ribosomal protein S11-like n=1 Tax=Rhizophora mucronata TaxID=61149 RepID=A0A2P2M3C9_RHIMU